MGREEVNSTHPVEQLLQEEEVPLLNQASLLQCSEEVLCILDGFQPPRGDVLQAKELQSCHFICGQSLRNVKKESVEVCIHFTSEFGSQHKQKLISFISNSSAIT